MKRAVSIINGRRIVFIAASDTVRLHSGGCFNQTYTL